MALSQVKQGPSVTPQVMQHLAVIRYIYEQGTSQAKKPYPESIVSVLSLHDSVELFVHLVSQLTTKVAISKPFGKQAKWEEYWTNITLNGSPLPYQMNMAELNRIRVEFKHHGSLPTQLDIEKAAAATALFLDDVTPKVFGIKFTSISLVNMVQISDVRTHMEKAEKLANRNKRTDAFLELTEAFNALMGHYSSYKMSLLHTHGNAHIDVTWPARGQRLDTKPLGNNEVNHKINEELRRLQSQITDITGVLTMAILGIDFARYSKLRVLTQSINALVIEGQPQYRFVSPEALPKYTRSDYVFARDFVIESAIRAQDYTARRW